MYMSTIGGGFQPSNTLCSFPSTKVVERSAKYCFSNVAFDDVCSTSFILKIFGYQNITIHHLLELLGKVKSHLAMLPFWSISHRNARSAQDHSPTYRISNDTLADSDPKKVPSRVALWLKRAELYILERVLRDGTNFQCPTQQPLMVERAVIIRNRPFLSHRPPD